MIHVVIIAHAVVFFIGYLVWPVPLCLCYVNRKIKLESERDFDIFHESLWAGYRFGVHAEAKVNEILERPFAEENVDDYVYDWLRTTARPRKPWDGYN